jgi:hypothetical protein
VGVTGQTSVPRDTISEDFGSFPFLQRLDKRYRDDIDPNIAKFLKE